MTVEEINNPFPGPKPYRAGDRHRFYGREELSHRLEGSLLANRCVTIYGPSGAGKSSLMQAAVIPALVETQQIRVTRVDAWPENVDPSAWLADAVYANLGLGERPADMPAEEALVSAAQRSARKSPRIVLYYLDQVEQLLSPARNDSEVKAFFDTMNRLVDTPLRNLRVVLSLREDYLGRFRDRLNEYGQLLSHNVRVGPLTVAELADTACKAADAGVPSQQWDLEQMRALMFQVRIPGQTLSDGAEAQAAYAQIVCRALFQQRALGNTEMDSGPIEAESILRGYFENTIDGLGPLGMSARRLLEDHLVTADGSRTLRTEKELQKLMPVEELAAILAALEGAAILYAQEHHGSRYFEIGHDWLARKVFDERQLREREEELRRREKEQEQALRKQKAQLRRYTMIAAASLAIAAGAIAVGVYAKGQEHRAQQKEAEAKQAQTRAEKAETRANQRAIEASDARLLAGVRELEVRGLRAPATKLLAAVQEPANARGWYDLAMGLAGKSALETTIFGNDKPMSVVMLSHDEKWLLTASTDGTAYVWDTRGIGTPRALIGSTKRLTSAVWSPNDAWVLTGSEDGSARIYKLSALGTPTILDPKAGPVTSMAFDATGEQVVIAAGNAAHVFSIDGTSKGLLEGHTGEITTVAFLPRSNRILTASRDQTARIFETNGGRGFKVFRGHTDEILFAVPNPDGSRFVTVSKDTTARIWDTSGKGQPIVLAGHERSIVHAAFSPDGQRVATASTDGTARVWAMDGKNEPVVLSGHTGALNSIAFRPDGRYVATASQDGTARVWPVEGGMPLDLAEEQGIVFSVAWSANGERLITFGTERQSSQTVAMLWRPQSLESLARERPFFFHSASIGPHGDVFVAACDDQSARLFRVDGKAEPVVFTGHDAWVTNAALSPDGQRVITTSCDQTAVIRPVDGQGEPIVLRHGSEGCVRVARFSPDGEFVATGSDDKRVRIFRANGTGEPILLEGHADTIVDIAYSADGKRIATASLDHTARVFDAAGPGDARAILKHDGAVLSVAWTPDGVRLVSTTESGRAWRWNVSNEIHNGSVWFKEPAPVRAATLSADGQYVAIAADALGVYIQQTNGTNRLHAQVSAPILSMMFLPERRELLAVLADNTTRRLTINIEQTRQTLFAMNKNCLSINMRMSHFGESFEQATDGYAKCELERSRSGP